MHLALEVLAWFVAIGAAWFVATYVCFCLVAGSFFVYNWLSARGHRRLARAWEVTMLGAVVPTFAVGGLLDVGFNYSPYGRLILGKPMHRETVSQHLKRTRRERTELKWRVRLADFICLRMLDPLAKDHC
jgi:hypothetical protein